jgi:GWxTD domain-containing protein
MPAVAAVLTLVVAAGMVVYGKPAGVKDAAKPVAVVQKNLELRSVTVQVLEPTKKLMAQAQQLPAPVDLPVRYRKWVDEDVVYIISDEEKKAFRQLNSDEERDHFVEQFWLRRDPTPGTAENEFKTEIYRRIGYANDHFTASVPGWKTDRGRIYIQYGMPDEIESHASTPTQTAFEQWLYHYIDGVGQNVIIEFVDKDGSGDFHMTMDPSEKDALRKTPGAAEFDRVEQYFKAQQPH